MLISVTIKPNSKHSGVIKDNAGYIISVKSPAKEGKANKELIELLSEYLNLPKSRLSIKKSLKSKHKLVEVL